MELEVAARNYIGKVTAGGQWKREVANVVPAFVRDAIRHYHIDKSEGVTEKLIQDWVDGQKISRRRKCSRARLWGRLQDGLQGGRSRISAGREREKGQAPCQLRIYPKNCGGGRNMGG